MKYLFLFLFAAAALGGGTRVIADDVSSYCRSIVVTDRGGVIYVSDTGELRTIDPDYSGDPINMAIDWGMQLQDWRPGRVSSLQGNPGGTMICFTQTAGVPEEYYTDERQNIPYPEIVAVCRSDGTAPRILGLSFDVGSGPHFAFTQDSRFVYGGPWLECRPTPADFIEFFAGDGSGEMEPWLLVDLDTGERSGDPGVIGDGFNGNPWSDLAAAGWYPPNTIVDITTQEILLRDTSVNSPAIISQWVLPDGGLAMTSSGEQVLRLADGSEWINPGDRINIYCRLQDGRYIFTRDSGETVLVGGIDWSDFSSVPAVEIPWMEGLYPGSLVREIPGSEWVAYLEGSFLMLAQLP
ncbi:MAG: hypothetical protein R6U39_08495 [Candidatus Aegiribacteria sp.]